MIDMKKLAAEAMNECLLILNKKIHEGATAEIGSLIQEAIDCGYDMATVVSSVGKQSARIHAEYSARCADAINRGEKPAVGDNSTYVASLLTVLGYHFLLAAVSKRAMRSLVAK